MKKIAIVVQRYGSEVNGGAEKYAKDLAEHLKDYYDVEVLTTTALDYDTWHPYYHEGEQIINGVRIRRFRVEKERKIKRFSCIDGLLRRLPFCTCVLEPLWIKEQGPYCPQLIQYIKKKNNDYDKFIFITYLYYTTVKGLPLVYEKAVFVPTAHDEYCIYFNTYKRLFQKASKIVCLTQEEREFIEQKFPKKDAQYYVAGTGIDVPFHREQGETYRKTMMLEYYILYLGRVDHSKGCDCLFEYYERYCKEKRNFPELVVVGKCMMNVPRNPHIHYMGMVSENEKYALLEGAEGLVMPSEHESLSLVVLEAMAFGIPVVVNGNCKVLAGHINKSNSGIEYRTYREFVLAVDSILQNEDFRKKTRINGPAYVNANYSWKNTTEIFRKAIEGV